MPDQVISFRRNGRSAWSEYAVSEVRSPFPRSTEAPAHCGAEQALGVTAEVGDEMRVPRMQTDGILRLWYDGCWHLTGLLGSPGHRTPVAVLLEQCPPDERDKALLSTEVVDAIASEIENSSLEEAAAAAAAVSILKGADGVVTAEHMRGLVRLALAHAEQHLNPKARQELHDLEEWLTPPRS